MNLEEIKAQYPAYANIPDQELADKIYEKHYSGKMPVEEYYQKIGFKSEPASFADSMEKFYRASGIHGANRGFAKIFGFGEHQKNTQQAYEQAKETNPLATEAGNIGAQLYSSIPFYQLAAMIPALKGGGLLKNSLQAGIGGVAKAGIETPYDEETRLGNMLTEGLENVGGVAALHGIGKGIKGGAKLIKHGAQSKEKIAGKIGTAAKELKSKYTGPQGMFENFIEKAESGNVKTDLHFSPRTSKIINKELEGVNKGVRKAVIKAHKTNDVRDIMDAESKLGKFKRNQFNNAKKGGILDQDAIDAATHFEKKLGEELERALSKQSPDLGKELKNIRKGYKEEYVPYLENPAIQKFLNNKSIGSDLMRSLQGNSSSGQQFRGQLAKHHPEVKANKILGNLLKTAFGGGGIAGTGYGAYKIFGDH